MAGMTYAGDRYQLDSQLLWHHLAGAAPERSVAAVDDARTNVDFFVCLVYGGALTAVASTISTAALGVDGRLFAGVVAGMCIAGLGYRLALVATDEWDAAVRGLIDHGRIGASSTDPLPST